MDEPGEHDREDRVRVEIARATAQHANRKRHLDSVGASDRPMIPNDLFEGGSLAGGGSISYRPPVGAGPERCVRAVEIGAAWTPATSQEPRYTRWSRSAPRGDGVESPRPGDGSGGRDGIQSLPVRIKHRKGP